MCSALLASERFASPDAVDQQGRTALHAAAFKGHAGTCLAILASEHFAAHDAVDKDDKTALHVAASNKLEAVCSAILASQHFTAHGVVDKDGNTALVHAAEHDMLAVCRDLLERTDVSPAAAAATAGALDHAIEAGNVDLINLFVFKGMFASSSARESLSPKGRTVIDMATQLSFAPGGAGAAAAADEFAHVSTEGAAAGVAAPCDASLVEAARAENDALSETIRTLGETNGALTARCETQSETNRAQSETIRELQGRLKQLEEAEPAASALTADYEGGKKRRS